MPLVGSSARWRRRFLNIHAKIMDGIERVWPACRSHCSSASEENKITRQLVVRLKQDRMLRSGPGHIVSQYELLPEEVVGDVGPKGYIDIAVLFRVGREKVYLALECKRLNVSSSGGGRKSLASEYVNEGMMRFVQAQYALGLPFGVMLGYVMDGDVVFALAAVKKRICECVAVLRCEPSGPKDIEAPGPFQSFSTTHQGPSCAIELRHFMLPV